MAREMGVYVRWGDIQVGLQADGVAWNPDVANDMVSRIKDLWGSTLAEAKQYGYFDLPDFDDDDDWVEVEEDADLEKIIKDLTEGTDG